ncbi:uncharacterized protein LOC121381490 [Gigantopelta aegis]|uniref:uncharacterized protein LOC121381490 n=1 Tax=Gigantopelta aegis TaxID=1735272 RepID=UPI001B88C41D|nr:uncharacterized protein LOC121381490 [Gigantopelta aegis]
MSDKGEFESLYFYGMSINNTYLWVIFALGFPGNLVCLTTLVKMKSTSAPMLYMGLLAIVDNLSICQKLLYHQLSYRKVEMGPAACKTLNFFTLVFATYANWLIVFMAAERSEAIINYFRTKSTRRRILVHSILLGITVLAIYLHLFWMFTDVDGIHCGIYQRYVPFYVGVWYWICASVYNLAPCFLLVIIDVLMSYRFRKISAVIADGCQNHCGHRVTGSQRSLGQETSAMVLAVAVAFVVMTLPRCVYIILESHWSVETTTLSHAQKHLINQITFVLSDARHAVNFYLYFFTGKIFRSSVICALAWKRKPDNAALMLTTVTPCTGKGSDL